MNFNTANSTFRQLMSNGLSYRVPSFQRDYSWSADEWDDLWQDLDFESTRYGVEHVLPENPGADWEQFDDRQREEFTYRLGNMTLLETAANRDLGNAGFDVKRPRFRESGLQATAKLGEDYDTWNVETIRERQTWMARQATSIWRIGF